MIDSDHDRAVARQVAAIVERVDDASGRVSATVDINHDRQVRAAARFRGPDVEEQAVLALRLVAVTLLRRGRSEPQCIDDASAWLRSCRCAKPLGLPVADAAEDLQAAFDRAAHSPK